MPLKNRSVLVYQHPCTHGRCPIPRGHLQQPPAVQATADEDQPPAGLGGAGLPHAHGSGGLCPGRFYRGPSGPHAHHQDLEPEPQHADGEMRSD